MRLGEQEALVLRQVAALLRRGVARGQAIDLARRCVGDVALADRLARVGQDLAEGQLPQGAGFERSLAVADAEGLERRAAAVDATLAADSALATVRLHTGAAVAIPAVLILVLVVLSHLVAGLTPGLPHAQGGLLSTLLPPVLGAAMPLGLGLLLLLRLPRRWVPAARLHDRAAQVLSGVDGAGDPMPPGATAAEQAYLSARAPAVGLEAAAAELSVELSAEAGRAGDVAAVGLPMVAAGLVLLAFGGVALLLYFPVLRVIRMGLGFG